LSCKNEKPNSIFSRIWFLWADELFGDRLAVIGLSVSNNGTCDAFAFPKSCLTCRISKIHAYCAFKNRLTFRLSGFTATIIALKFKSDKNTIIKLAFPEGKAGFTQITS
jgi:hypothetical protein